MSKPPHAFVSPHILHQQGHWSADLFCGSAAKIFRGDRLRVTIRDLGSCFEGWRVSTQPGASGYDPRIAETPIFRQANLGCLSFRLDTEHWNAPTIEEMWCVQPGDVVLNKIPPLRAALATLRLPRHPIDGNCILIRGIKDPYGAWVALCLNQEPYAAYLTQRMGAAVLPRVSLKALSELGIPLPTASEVNGVSAEIWEWNEATLDNTEFLMRLVAEAEEYVAEEAAQLDDNSATGLQQSLSTGSFFPAESINDSWLPRHVELSHRQRRLERRLGWLPLEQLLSNVGVSRDRLTNIPERGRYLRLSDVNLDLSITEPEEEEAVRWSARVFCKPLTSSEVLLSTLVTNPRVAFVDEAPTSTIYVTDHWERLLFRETPGAWALVLNTTAVRSQLLGMAMGTVQQFTHPASIRCLRVPNVPLSTRQRWDLHLYRHHQRKRELDAQWRSLFCRAQRLFENVHTQTKRQVALV